MYDIGSFDPDSISKSESVLFFRARFLERSMLKTDAASVEDITEPIKILSNHGRCNTK